MLKKILIANRGEIAVRIIQAGKQLGIPTVAVYSEADKDSLHVRLADESINLGDGAAEQNYLNIPKIIQAAKDVGADSIHPGYGFLAENAEFSAAVAENGLTFIGPSAETISIMGEKMTARALARTADVPMTAGTTDPVTTVAEIEEFAKNHGFPLIIKASHGGGGRGMRLIHDESEIEDGLQSAQREAAAAFGNSEVYLEQFLERARHIEVQVLSDLHGNTVTIGDRDCSVQRRHQKLIEEAPAPGLSDELRQAMSEASIRLSQEVKYAGAGTIEYLVDGDKFYFLEMNTRIQVEHPVTEQVFGVDLVQEQIKIASGQQLSKELQNLTPNGVAFEVRINAEDSTDGLFLPSPGPIKKLKAPRQSWVRFDAGYESGDEVLPLYDSLIGKLIVWGEDRKIALGRLKEAIEETVIDGVQTTLPAAHLIIQEKAYKDVAYDTNWLEREVDFAMLVSLKKDRSEVVFGGRFYKIPVFSDVAAPSVTGAPAGPQEAGTLKSSTLGSRQQQEADSNLIASPMQGTIIKVNIEAGATVSKGDVLFVLEAMKMENPIKAPQDGVIEEIHATVGGSFAAKEILANYQAD